MISLLLAAALLESADKAMNAQRKRAAAALKQKDAEVDRSDDRLPGWFSTLLSAQRAWLMYRDQSCLQASFEPRGGSMASPLEAPCKANRTGLRSEELRACSNDPKST